MKEMGNVIENTSFFPSYNVLIMCAKTRQQQSKSETPNLEQYIH
jgi:hypothetical protein